MKFIQKLNEPPELTHWKKQQQSAEVNCNYGCLQNPEKQKVHESLLKEQGYICCYCCNRIEKSSSHIEHFAPQSKTDDALSVNYRNLHASCGSTGNWPKHCGNHRENFPVPISPLDTQCESYFTYKADGKISVVENHLRQNDVEKTIDVLALNSYDLKESRQQAFEVLTDLTDDEANLLIKKYLDQDKNNKFVPFCIAVVDYLKQYYNIRQEC